MSKYKGRGVVYSILGELVVPISNVPNFTVAAPLFPPEYGGINYIDHPALILRRPAMFRSAITPKGNSSTSLVSQKEADFQAQLLDENGNTNCTDSHACYDCRDSNLLRDCRKCSECSNLRNCASCYRCTGCNSSTGLFECVDCNQVEHLHNIRGAWPNPGGSLTLDLPSDIPQVLVNVAEPVDFSDDTDDDYSPSVKRPFWRCEECGHEDHEKAMPPDRAKFYARMTEAKFHLPKCPKCKSESFVPVGF